MPLDVIKIIVINALMLSKSAWTVRLIFTLKTVALCDQFFVLNISAFSSSALFSEKCAVVNVIKPIQGMVLKKDRI